MRGVHTHLEHVLVCLESAPLTLLPWGTCLLQGCRLGWRREERWHHSLHVAPCAWPSLGLSWPENDTQDGSRDKLLKNCMLLNSHLHWSISKLPRYFKPTISHRSYIGFCQSWRVQKKLQTNVGKCDVQWMKIDWRKYFCKPNWFQLCFTQGLALPVVRNTV